jgi:CRISPR-associated protein Cmr5
MTEKSQTLAQRRAAHALTYIKGLELKGEKYYGKYKSYTKSLPANILMSGLGQAAATLCAAAKGKSDDPHRLLYDHLSDWLCSDDENSPYPKGDLLENITTHDEQNYIHAQAEAMAYLEWLKKFAVAFLKDADKTKNAVSQSNASEGSQ